MHIRIIESARFLGEREREKERRKTSVYLIITITRAYLERAEDCDEPIVSASHLRL